MIQRLGDKLSDWSERFVPDPFVLALLLLLLTLVLGVGFGREVADLSLPARVGELSRGMFAEFYASGLVKFAFQMVLVLVLGHALAMSRPVEWFIERVVTYVRTPGAAVVVVSLVACAASLIQWGLGAIAGAFVAREMGRVFAERDIPVHYPLLGAAGYAGFLVWHGGFSGSAPLKIAGKDHFLVDEIGVVPISETILGTMNLTITGTLVVIIPLLFWRMMPSDPAEMVPFSGGARASAEDDERRKRDDGRPRGALAVLEQSRLVNLVIGALLVGALGLYFVDEGLSGWNLDAINLLFLALGLLCHASPTDYVSAVADGAKSASGIILQFPFYFGILGLLKASGLITQISEFFIEVATAETYPLFTFVSGAIVNFFVPSGGGQWAVQGPVMVEAIDALGVEVEKVVMALAYGDAWTNMLQPFWALPLLGIMNLRARDIIGYTALVMLITGPVILLLLYLF